MSWPLQESEEAVLLRARMHRVRHRLDDEVAGLRDNAQRLMDWKYYVRRHPWLTLGAAAVAGYLAIPKPANGATKVYLDAETARRLVEQPERVVFESAPPPVSTAATGVLASVGTMALNILVRTGMNLLAEQWRAPPGTAKASPAANKENWT
jgi:hypothetical protein